MKDELTKDQWLAKQSQEFKVIRLSKCCRREIADYGFAWIHSATICVKCGKINPEVDEILYQCSLCLEEHEDEECNCYG